MTFVRLQNGDLKIAQFILFCFCKTYRVNGGSRISHWAQVMPPASITDSVPGESTQTFGRALRGFWRGGHKTVGVVQGKTLRVH